MSESKNKGLSHGFQQHGWDQSHIDCTNGMHSPNNGTIHSKEEKVRKINVTIKTKVIIAISKSVPIIRQKNSETKNFHNDSGKVMTTLLIRSLTNHCCLYSLDNLKNNYLTKYLV